MTLEELKSLIEKANETQHDDHNLNCGVCKAAADLSDMSRTALPAALALIEQMAEALGFYGTRENWACDEQVNLDEHFGTPMAFRNDGHGYKARQVLAAYEAFKKNVGGE